MKLGSFHLYVSRFSQVGAYFFAPLFLSALTFLFYYPSLNYPFQFDDIANILKNFNIRFFDSSRYFFRVRWLGDLLNTFNYQWGGFEPFWYRVTNVTIHIVSGLLIFYCIYLLCSRTKRNLFLSQHAWTISFLTSALFLFHPVQTQTVSYVIQARLEGVAVLCIILTLLWFCASSWATSHGGRTFSRIMLLLCSFLACGTKEISIVTPFLALIIDWFFIAESDFKKFRANWFNHLLVWFGIVGTFIYFQSIKWFTMLLGGNMSVGNNRGNLLTEEAISTITPYHYCISEFKVIIHYFTIFFAPFFLSVEYDWRLVPTFFCAESFIPFLILSSVVCAVLYFSWHKKYSILSFGVLWFLIAVAPRSTIVPSGELVCDYKTYLASIGVLFILACMIAWVTSRGTTLASSFLSASLSKRLYPAFLTGEIVVYGIITFFLMEKSYSYMAPFFALGTALCIFLLTQALSAKPIIVPSHPFLFFIIFLTPLAYTSLVRNEVWENSESFWRDVVEKAPTKARGHNNLGVALVNAGKYDDAIEEYRKAIALDRHYCDPWSNLAVVYSHRNEVEKGIAALKNALRIHPAHPEAYNNLGTFYRTKQDLESAQYCFQEAIKYRPYYGKAYLNLSSVYLQKGDPESAWMYAVKATQTDLDNYDGFNELGRLGMIIGKYKEAAEAFETALQKKKKEAIVADDYIKIADAHLRDRNFNSSLHYYSMLQKMYPHDHKYLYALGEVHLELHNIDKALALFSRYLETNDPLFPQAHLRVAQCLEKLNRFNEAQSYLTTILKSNLHESIKQIAENQLKKYNA